MWASWHIKAESFAAAAVVIVLVTINLAKFVVKNAAVARSDDSVGHTETLYDSWLLHIRARSWPSPWPWYRNHFDITKMYMRNKHEILSSRYSRFRVWKRHTHIRQTKLNALRRQHFRCYAYGILIMMMSDSTTTGTTYYSTVHSEPKKRPHFKSLTDIYRIWHTVY